MSVNVYKSVWETRRFQKEGLEKGQGKHLVCIYFDKYTICFQETKAFKHSHMRENI